MRSAIKTLAKRRLMADGLINKQALIKEWVDSPFAKLEDFVYDQLNRLIGCQKIVVPASYDTFDVYLLAREIKEDMIGTNDTQIGA